MTATDIRDPFTIDPDSSMEAHYDAETDRTEPIPLPEPAAGDPAPYGRRADGTPKAKPGPKRAAGSAAPAPRRAPSPGPRKAPRMPAAPKQPDYRPAILGLLQVPMMALTMLGRQTKNPALQADGHALAMHAPGLAEALNETARQQPQVARALETVLKAGPYGAIIGAVVPLVMQLAANHKVISPIPAMGVHPPEELVAASDAGLVAMAGAGA